MAPSSSPHLFRIPADLRQFFIIGDMTRPQQVNAGGAKGLLYGETRGLEIVEVREWVAAWRWEDCLKTRLSVESSG